MLAERQDAFKRWLSRPPRPHGVTILDRRVSFLEFFYDLVYVAVIGEAGHRLAQQISVRSVVESAVIFGLTWIAWVNGTLYVELHGGEDGRTRNIVFAQMCILTPLAVFTGNAADSDGRPRCPRGRVAVQLMVAHPAKTCYRWLHIGPRGTFDAYPRRFDDDGGVPDRA